MLYNYKPRKTPEIQERREREREREKCLTTQEKRGYLLGFFGISIVVQLVKREFQGRFPDRFQVIVLFKILN